MIPDWMSVSENIGLPREVKGKARPDYLDRTLSHVRRLVKDTMFVEKWARREGFLQGLDPRVKLVGSLALVLAATLAHGQPVVWSVSAIPLVLALASGLPARAFLGRVWLSVPLFTGLIVLPATLNLITPGAPVLVLFHANGSLGPWALPGVVAVTRPGLDAALLVVGRAGGCVSAVILLTLTTSWSELLSGLRALHVSSVFVMVIEMSHRYAFVLVSLLEKTHLAKRSRTIRASSAKGERAWVGSRIGAVLQRSRALTEDVYHAMLARGYDGEPRTLRRMRMSRNDWLYALFSVTLLAVLLGLDRGWL